MGASNSSVCDWTSGEVAERVNSLGPTFSKCESVIKDYGINGEMLLELTPETLTKYIDEDLHLLRLGMELRKLRGRHEAELLGHEEKELSKLGGPMVDWLNSINVRKAGATTPPR